MFKAKYLTFLITENELKKEIKRQKNHYLCCNEKNG